MHSYYLSFQVLDSHLINFSRPVPSLSLLMFFLVCEFTLLSSFSWFELNQQNDFCYFRLLILFQSVSWAFFVISILVALQGRRPHMKGVMYAKYALYKLFIKY